MTVTTTTPKVTANGNGTATVFSFSPVVIYVSTDLVVTKTDTSGVITTLTEGVGATNYSVTVASYPGTGSITYPAASGTNLATNEKITMKSVLPLTQLTDLENQGGYFAETQEKEFDRGIKIDQQLSESIERTIRLPISIGSGVSADLPTPVANKVFAWDAAGENIVYIDSATLGTTVSYANMNTDRFTGDNTVGPFSLSADPVSIHNTNVHIDGVYQQKNSYSMAAEDLTFGSAPATGVTIEVTYGTAALTGAVADGSVTTEKLANLAVTTAKLGVGSVTTVEILNATILDEDIAANVITAASIAANTITATQIAANTITATQIAANTITSTEIAPNAINDSELGTITELAAASHSHTLADISDSGTIATQSSSNVTITGGTITGVAGVVSPNLVVNGGLNIWEGGTTFTGTVHQSQTASGGWYWNFVGTGVIDTKRSTNTPTDTGGYSLHVDVTTADTSIVAADYSVITHIIEGFNLSPALFGTASAKALTVTFDVSSTKTGIHCISFRNAIFNRNYIVEYTINSTNTWETKTITFTGDTTGTWESGSGRGLLVSFALAMGSNFHTTAGVWGAGDKRSTSNQVNSLDNVSNNFYLKNLKIEISANATIFEDTNISTEETKVHRYSYAPFTAHASASLGVGQATTTTAAKITIPLPTRMRGNVDTILISNATHFSVYQADGTLQACTALAKSSDSSQSIAVLDVTVAANLVAGNAVYLRTNTTSATMNIIAEY